MKVKTFRTGDQGDERTTSPEPCIMQYCSVLPAGPAFTSDSVVMRSTAEMEKGWADGIGCLESVHACSVGNVQEASTPGCCPAESHVFLCFWGRTYFGPERMSTMNGSFRDDVAVGLNVASFLPYNLAFPSFSVSDTCSFHSFYINSILSCLIVYCLD